jgi:hypothetical protein
MKLKYWCVRRGVGCRARCYHMMAEVEESRREAGRHEIEPEVGGERDHRSLSTLVLCIFNIFYVELSAQHGTNRTTRHSLKLSIKSLKINLKN